MKFDFVIGNPPYQEETDSDSTRMPPVYNLFMDEAYKIADRVEMITPARFLFNAGYTPKAWNEKMLNDPHFKIEFYEPISANMFANTDIKGGVVISYRDVSKLYGAIGIFTKYPELNSIVSSIKAKCNNWLPEIISSPLSFQLSKAGVDVMKQLHPEIYCNPEKPDTPRLRSSAFTNLAEICLIEKPTDGDEYIRLYGLYENKRTTRYIKQEYINDISGTLDSFTVLMPKASGIGQFGEPTGPTVIAGPGIGYTQTFIGIGRCAAEEEARNIQTYIKTKLARALLGVLKITQDCPAPKWRYVPLQDFTPSSDIDWTVSIAEIDRQLYKKYGLSEEEIEFIETHVKEME